MDQELHHLNVKSNKHEDGEGIICCSTKYSSDIDILLFSEGLSSDQQNVQVELQTRQEVLRSQQDALIAASKQIHGTILCVLT